MYFVRWAGRISISLSLLMLGACQGTAPVAPDPDLNANTSPITTRFNYIALGDSLAAGVQDAHTNRFGQTQSYPTWIARQLRKAYGTDFVMPLMGLDSQRINPEAVPTLLGISGEDAHSMIYGRATAETIDAESSITDRTLYPLNTPAYRGTGTSQLEAALYLAEKWQKDESEVPKIITFFLGNNEILGSIVGLGSENYTISAMESQLTDPEQFHHDINYIFENLAQTQAQIFVATLPDTVQIAYLVDPQLITRWTGEPVAHYTLPQGSKISLAAALQVFGDYLNGSSLSESMDVHLSDASVMTLEEQQLIRNHVTAYNQSLRQLAQGYGFHVVDLFEELKTPQTIDGIFFTSDYGFGKFFSLDGVHFSHTGHAHTANLFIKVMNQELGAKIPLIPLSEVHAGDPYRDSDGDGFPEGPNFEPQNSNQALVAKLRDPDDHDPHIIPDLVNFP